MPENGAQPELPLDWEGLVNEGIEARKMGDQANWRLGDLASQVQTTYGNGDMPKYAARVRLAYKTLLDYERVAQAYGFSLRNENLSWWHHREVAPLPNRLEWLRRAEENNWTVEQLRDASRTRKPAPEPPAVGAYRTVILDPPWPMDVLHRDTAVKDDRRKLDYPTQTLEEIRDSTAWEHIAADGCHVYLWTTQRFLDDAWHLMEEKGISPEVVLVWHKPKGFTPFTWMYNAEFVVFGRVASLPFEKVGEKVVFQGDVREHSRKPDEFYEVVRRVSPEPRIDCHSREPREGFDQWGTEKEYFAEVVDGIR